MLVTPEAGLCPSWLARTRAALEGGVRCVQLRQKTETGRGLWRAAERLREFTRACGALLVVNGRADVARACEADGVHLGAAELPTGAARRLLGPGALVGYSAHAGDAPACWSGASYVTYSPIWASPGKGPALGAAALAAFAGQAGVPVVALGGVGAGQVSAAAAAGACGVAVIREIYDAPDPAAAARRLCAAWEMR
jgi:thiamine-phosphate pyrophosphorylase